MARGRGRYGAIADQICRWFITKRFVNGVYARISSGYKEETEKEREKERRRRESFYEAKRKRFT